MVQGIVWRLINRFLKDDIYRIERGADQGKIGLWLWTTFSMEGWVHYYTVRKKMIAEKLMSGLSQEEYWKFVGRMDELKALSQNIKDEAKRRKDNQKKVS